MASNPVILFHHWTMEALAKQVVAHPAYAGRVRLGRCEWNSFPDSTPSIQIAPEDCQAMDTGEHDVAFLASFADPALIFEQLAVLYAMPRMRARHFRVLIPYFSTGTMERVERPGQVATAATMARILSAVPPCPTGPSTVVIFDIHALQEQFYFSDAVLVQLKSAVYLLKQALAARTDRDLVSIAFPDDGAAKRFKHLVKEFPHVVCTKVREGDARKVTVKEGEAKGRHCVILDDLVQTGGTLLESAKALKEAGAAKVSCFVTHGVFPNESWRRFIGDPTSAAPRLFEKVWITDSVPATVAAVTAADINGSDASPFEVLSLAPLIGNLITGDAPLEIE